MRECSMTIWLNGDGQVVQNFKNLLPDTFDILMVIFDILLLAKSMTLKSLQFTDNSAQCMNQLICVICFSLSALSPCESDIDCNNKGTCIDGTCSCNKGWEGSSDCSGIYVIHDKYQ